jgi:hypothetical protein
MTVRAKLDLRARWLGFVALVFCGLLVGRQTAIGQESKSEQNSARWTFHIEVHDGKGDRVAGPETNPRSSTTASTVLAFDREYQPGDRIVFGGPPRMALRVDESIPECMLYLPGSDERNIWFPIPYGREENQTGSAYSPEGFAGKSHRIWIRALTKKEIKAYRNLALNPCDLREPENMPAPYFPHATTNSASRNAFDFEARNAIDGVTQNGHHGVWPYQSWGPQLRTDLWWKVDFGRDVELDKIRVMVRADFPHDSYWKSADVEFSDGSHVSIKLGSSAELQDFKFPKRRVSWLRLTNLVPDDPAKWCSFIEVEAWGRDLP